MLRKYALITADPAQPTASPIAVPITAMTSVSANIQRKSVRREIPTSRIVAPSSRRSSIFRTTRHSRNTAAPVMVIPASARWKREITSNVSDVASATAAVERASAPKASRSISAITASRFTPGRNRTLNRSTRSPAPSSSCRSGR